MATSYGYLVPKSARVFWVQIAHLSLPNPCHHFASRKMGLGEVEASKNQAQRPSMEEHPRLRKDRIRWKISFHGLNSALSMNRAVDSLLSVYNGTSHSLWHSSSRNTIHLRD